MTVRLSLRIEEPPSLKLSTDMTQSSGVYGGPYSVTPTVEGFSLETAGLAMKYDMDVEPIPFVKATNEADGYTFTIA